MESVTATNNTSL